MFFYCVDLPNNTQSYAKPTIFSLERWGLKNREIKSNSATIEMQILQFRKTRQVTSDRHLKYRYRSTFSGPKSAGHFNLPDGFCSIAKSLYGKSYNMINNQNQNSIQITWQAILWRLLLTLLLLFFWESPA